MVRSREPDRHELIADTRGTAMNALPTASPTCSRPRSRAAVRVASLALGLALVVVAGACSSSKKAESGATSVAPATSVATATTAAPATTDTSSKPTTSTTKPAPKPPTTPITIKTSTDGTSPDGSGCSPSSATLPDGTWFGVLKSVDPQAGTIGIDLACWFTGAAANAAATADDPAAEVPVPNDYYIRNQVPTVYTTHAVPDLAVVPLEETPGGPTGGNGPTQTGVAAASTILNSQTPKLVWVQVTDGWVTVVQAQFTP
jgi:hypothetical protein